MKELSLLNINRSKLMKIKSPNLFLVAVTTILISPFCSHLPAQSLTWKIDNGTVAGTNPVTGSFTVDNENDPFPNITFSNIMVDGLTFSAADVINISLANPSGSGIEAIDWLNGFNILSLVFDSPLTTGGGTVLLNDIVSDFDGNAISGSVTNQSSTAVPESSTLSGLVTATTLGFGVFWKRKIKG